MSNPPSFLSGDLLQIFDSKRQESTGETLEQIRQNYFIAAKMNDDASGSMGGLNINVGDLSNASSLENEKKKKADNDLVMMVILEAQLADLERSMAQHFENLREKYGDDVIGGMASTFLSEEENAGLDTDEEKLAALARKFLDEDGNIREEYRGLEEAEYIRDWYQAQDIKLAMERYNGKIELTQEEKNEIIAKADIDTVTENYNKLGFSENAELKTNVSEALNNDMSDQVETKATTGFQFS